MFSTECDLKKGYGRVYFYVFQNSSRDPDGDVFRGRFGAYERVCGWLVDNPQLHAKDRILENTCDAGRLRAAKADKSVDPGPYAVIRLNQQGNPKYRDIFAQVGNVAVTLSGFDEPNDAEAVLQYIVAHMPTATPSASKEPPAGSTSGRSSANTGAGTKGGIAPTRPARSTVPDYYGGAVTDFEEAAVRVLTSNGLTIRPRETLDLGNPNFSGMALEGRRPSARDTYNGYNIRVEVILTKHAGGPVVSKVVAFLQCVAHADGSRDQYNRLEPYHQNTIPEEFKRLIWPAGTGSRGNFDTSAWPKDPATKLERIPQGLQVLTYHNANTKDSDSYSSCLGNLAVHVSYSPESKDLSLPAIQAQIANAVFAQFRELTSGTGPQPVAEDIDVGTPAFGEVKSATMRLKYGFKGAAVLEVGQTKWKFLAMPTITRSRVEGRVNQVNDQFALAAGRDSVAVYDLSKHDWYPLKDATPDDSSAGLDKNFVIDPKQVAVRILNRGVATYSTYSGWSGPKKDR